MPERPWQKVGVDIMTYKQKDYLNTTDYRSNFWEIDYLRNTTSKTVINKLKAHFARYGIPDSIVSDLRSVFLSDEFRHCREKWGFELYPSSAHHHQSNEKVESSLKTAKRMLTKCMKSGEDQYLGLLDIRNTPTQGVDSSPAQRLFSRRTKTLIPITNSLLHPNNQSNSDTELVGCFGFNGPLRQYFSLYRAVSQREGDRGGK